jgi:hypothetical protein
MLREALDVMEAWGFTYVTSGVGKDNAAWEDCF